MARTKISPPTPPRPSKAPHRTSVLNISRSVREQPTKAVTRGYWANLAHTLGGSLNDEYLSAMETLASLFTLPPSEFVAISSKLMHNALTHRGVQAYEFSYCPPALVPYKVAYFRLLCLLRDMRHRIDDTLQERVQRLLLPLSPSFQVHTGEGPSRSVKDHAPSASGGLREHRVPMPPPPINWRDAHIQAYVPENPGLRLHRSPRHLWTPGTEGPCGALAPPHQAGLHNGDGGSLGPVKRRPHTSGYRVVSSPSPDEDQENTTPNSHRRAGEDGVGNFTAAEDDEDDSSLPRVTIIRPNPLRRFGIFCTGKSSMHGPNPRAWRHSRPIAVRQSVE
ncbi:hypothetical protein FA13DRAFT_1730100 [Coprinellus micaceus]|uniref:Uncharacterized protein n=1 Tax=Coprinellus micaceus TaxID=71717 RepID=A0A4Y7TI08_COPMI|nr:hypothetical protein FA13DRAFT_1730100 [Coprinellus micaceus]